MIHTLASMQKSQIEEVKSLLEYVAGTVGMVLGPVPSATQQHKTELGLLHTAQERWKKAETLNS
jgi:hypothetical protein